MKKLSISDLRPEVSFTFDQYDPFYYVVVYVRSEPVRSKFADREVLTQPYIICYAKLKNADHLSTSQTYIPFDLLEMVQFYEYLPHSF